MNGGDCAQLVNQLISTWPAGVKGFVWTAALADLDYRLAHAAYLELRAGEDRPPSVARFLAAYGQHRAAATGAHQRPPPGCQLCDGDGYVSAPPEIAHNPRFCKGTPGVVKGEDRCCCRAAIKCRRCNPEPVPPDTEEALK